MQENSAFKTQLLTFSSLWSLMIGHSKILSWSLYTLSIIVWLIARNRERCFIPLSSNGMIGWVSSLRERIKAHQNSAKSLISTRALTTGASHKKMKRQIEGSKRSEWENSRISLKLSMQVPSKSYREYDGASLAHASKRNVQNSQDDSEGSASSRPFGLQWRRRVCNY